MLMITTSNVTMIQNTLSTLFNNRLRIQKLHHILTPPSTAESPDINPIYVGGIGKTNPEA